MTIQRVKVFKLPHFDPALPLPAYQTEDASGADIRACLGPGKRLTLPVGQRLAVPTGLSFALAPGFEIQMRPRSGLSLKTGLMLPNAPGTIDADYRGEVKILLANLGLQEEVIEHGDRLAQLVLCPVVRAEFVVVDSLEKTRRGSGAFGHTGMK